MTDVILRRPFWTMEQMKTHKDRFVPIYREMIESGQWAALPISSQKIYPIVRLYANKKSRLSFPRRSVIQKLAGYSNKQSITTGLAGLEEVGLIEIVKEDGKEKNRLLDDQFNGDDAKFFMIPSEYIVGGTWAVLPPSATSLYAVLGARHFL